MKKTRGFTLVELLITLAIAGILAGLAGPSFFEMIQNNRITSTTNHLISHINYARSEAVRLNRAVNIARTSGTANDLSQGWTIYSDAGSVTGNTAYSAGDGDIILRQFEGYGNRNITLFTDVTGNQWIAFAPNGTLAEGGNRVFIAVCDTRGVNNGRLITIGLTGRVAITNANSATDPLTDCTP
jgi:type IV fimbrial biogenesis protein FimT